MKIAVVDDNLSSAQRIKKFIQKLLNPNPGRDAVDIFKSGEELLKRLKIGERYDVFFLDIEMPSINGLKLADCIRSFDFHGRYNRFGRSDAVSCSAER